MFVNTNNNHINKTTQQSDSNNNSDVDSVVNNLVEGDIGVVNILIKEKKSICSWCFDALIHELENRNYSYIPDVINKLKKQKINFAFFVKWMKLYDKKNLGSYDHNLYELKGCMGCLAKNELTEIKHYALQSALNDLRFEQIVLEDIPYLMVTITYIFNFEKCKHLYDWEIGKHGVKIYFKIRGKAHSATFLPDVALHHNFTHELTIKKLIRKANFYGEITEELLNLIEVERYQGVSCSLTYNDYENFSINNGEEI